MQDEDKDLYKNTFGVQVSVVGGAILVLLIIGVYLHFDAKITKFIDDAKSAWANLKKRTKARIRRRITKTRTSAKRRVMAKLQIIRGKIIWKELEKLGKMENLGKIEKKI